MLLAHDPGPKLLYGECGPELFVPVVGLVVVGLDDPVRSGPPPPPVAPLPPEESLCEPDEPSVDGAGASEDPPPPVPPDAAGVVPAPPEPESVAGLGDWMLYVTGTTCDGAVDFLPDLRFVRR